MIWSKLNKLLIKYLISKMIWDSIEIKKWMQYFAAMEKIIQKYLNIIVK